MNSLDYVFADPELLANPPVLVDVGAAGGLNPAWRQIARYSIGVGFEPDTREAPALSTAQQQFKRWIFCPCIATPEPPAGGQHPLHLARAPQCSSSLPPHHERLAEWVFADQFEVLRTASLPAQKLGDALQNVGIGKVDWLKLDTQGTDLRLFQSLSDSAREALIAVEFEPGIMEAYQGEDHGAEVMSAMRETPFWMADLQVGRTPRGRASDLAAVGSLWSRDWLRRLAPRAPGWVGLTYLRDIAVPPPPTDRRGWLLTWAFATALGQHGYALTVATQGREKFADDRFAGLHTASTRAVKRAMWRFFPRWVGERFIRR